MKEMIQWLCVPVKGVTFSKEATHNSPQLHSVF